MKNKITLYVTLSLIALGLQLIAQEKKVEKAEKVEKEEKEEISFFTGISPVILNKSQTDINLSNTLTSFWLTSTQYIPSVDAYRIADRKRYSRFDQLLRVTYGFSENKRWDLGLELRFAHTRLDEAARSSPFRVLQGIKSDTSTGRSYHGFGLMGLRARAMLFKNIPELTIQGSVHYPMARSPESSRKLGYPQTQAGLGASYFIQSGSNTFYFIQADWTTRFQAELENVGFFATNHIISGSTFMVVKIWEDSWYVFPSISYNVLGRIDKGNFRRLNQQLLGGLGLFFQPSPQFSILINANLPFLLSSGSNLITYDKETFTGITIGLRTLLN
jgi:hypothetical protein